MSRKDYIQIAATIKSARQNANDSFDAMVATSAIARDLAVMFKRDNDRFDRIKFLEACGVTYSV